MTEEALFLAALDIPDPTARAEYLAGACGDATVRGRVEALLLAHDKSGEFLDVPAGDQLRPDPAYGTTATFHGRSGDDPATEEKPGAPTFAERLSFLGPATRPDSLGRLGHYEVLAVIGRGGFGIVLKAFDDVLHRVVAVKVLAPELAATSPARKRFLREARAAAAVRHENVVQIYAVEESPLPYLVMEYIPGETLQQRINRSGPLEIADTVRIAGQVARGLAAAHATGLIHRDVKPGNVLLDAAIGEKVKLTDFGLARAADDASLTQSGVVAGTPMYMAPEQALGEPIDRRADLFSLGSVLNTMVTGRPPFRAATTMAVLKRVCDDTPRPIREVIPEVPEWLCAAIAKLHAKNPDGRFQSATEVADRLAEGASAAPDAGPAPQPWAGRARKRLSRRLLAVVALGVLLPSLFALTQMASPRARRIVGNYAQVEFTADPGLTSVLVLRDDALVEDWMNLNTHPSPRLPPGRYRVNPACAPGREVAHWKVTVVRLFDNTSATYAGPSCEFEVGRADFVYVHAVMRDKAPREEHTQEPDGWVQLFNGKDLTGWKNAEWADDPCKVEGGCLVAAGDVALYSVKEFKDFHCRIEIKVSKGAWGEWHFRCGRGGEGEGSTVISPGHKTGGLWFAKAMKPVRLFNPAKDDGTLPDTWLTVEVMAVGKEVTVLVNGTKTTEMKVAELRATGRLGLVSGRRDAVVTVRKVEVKELSADPMPAATEWERAVAAMPAEEQVKAVAERLKQLNLGFDGVVTHRIEKGTVVELNLSTKAVADISPVRALAGLKTLRCQGPAPTKTGGKLSDLTPLRGMALEALTCEYSPLADLGPLRDMPLKDLHIGVTKVTDLSPLKGMKLKILNISENEVVDLSPLADMPLEVLWCAHGPVTDLAPLKGLPLTSLECDFEPKRDGAILRSIKTLQTINYQPAAKFWKEADAGRPESKK